MFDKLRKLWAATQQAGQHADAWHHAQIAYARGATLPGILRVYAGVTPDKADDAADDAAQAILGEFKQSVYNASELLKGNIALAQGFAGQLDGLYGFLDRAEKAPLRELLEKTDADR